MSRSNFCRWLNSMGICRTSTRKYNNFHSNHEPIRNLMAIQNQIVDFQGTFFEVNLGHIVKQFQRWERLLPRIRPYYAVKCQPDRRVIELLATLGTGFDCASQEEMQLAIESCEKAYCDLDINSDQWKDTIINNIIFANPFKFKQDMIFAKNYGIQRTTFDSEGELYRLKQYWPDAQLLIRVCTRKVFQAKCQLGEKFGVRGENIDKLLKKARELNFEVVGVSFHVGNMCQDFSAWPETAEYCSLVMKQIEANGFDAHILDIGGGFPGLSSMINEEEIQLQERFEKMCNNLNSVINVNYSDRFKIISEPGTFFVHGAFSLATEIIGKRQLKESDYAKEFSTDKSVSSKDRAVKIGSILFENPYHLQLYQNSDKVLEDHKRFIYMLDDGVYGSFNILQFMEYKFLLLAILNPDGGIKQFLGDNSSYLTKIYGPTCDTLDCICPESNLPELDVGEWLVWADMGAYTNASRSDFNGITRPHSYYFISDEAQSFIESLKRKVDHLKSNATV